jgi:hypothetical protein
MYDLMLVYSNLVEIIDNLICLGGHIASARNDGLSKRKTTGERALAPVSLDSSNMTRNLTKSAAASLEEVIHPLSHSLCTCTPTKAVIGSPEACPEAGDGKTSLWALVRPPLTFFIIVLFEVNLKVITDLHCPYGAFVAGILSSYWMVVDSLI